MIPCHQKSKTQKKAEFVYVSPLTQPLRYRGYDIITPFHSTRNACRGVSTPFPIMPGIVVKVHLILPFGFCFVHDSTSYLPQDPAFPLTVIGRHIQDSKHYWSSLEFHRASILGWWDPRKIRSKHCLEKDRTMDKVSQCIL